VAGRSVLQDILGRFLVSNEWRSWSRSPQGAELLSISATAPLAVEEPQLVESKPLKMATPPQRAWDGWD